jgi:hypothetical protein
MEDSETVSGPSKFQYASERTAPKFIVPLGTRPQTGSLDDQGIVVRFPGKAKIFFCSSKAAISALKAKQPSFQWVINWERFPRR